ncbi:MAG: phosphoribosylformylglycinamidine synthase I [Sulfolobaceae archaeon]
MIAIVKFPGSTCEYDTYKALKELKLDAEIVRHREFDPDKYTAVILPGGFSFGDYLRAGAIAAHTEIVRKIKEMANEGKVVIGICNGFQILVESGILPGALLKNLNLRFISKWVYLRVLRRDTILTKRLQKEILVMPIAHSEGRYFIDDLEKAKKLAFLAYSNQRGEITPEFNPNGSILNIAGIANEEGNVIGMMPHPERASFITTSPFNSIDGLELLRGLKYIEN